MQSSKVSVSALCEAPKSPAMTELGSIKISAQMLEISKNNQTLFILNNIENNWILEENVVK